MITPVVTESDWLPRLSSAAPWQPPLQPTLILSPHPDDETLGAGGLIACLRAAAVDVSVVAVTDGENAYLDRADADPAQLGRLREHEQAVALRCLGVDAANIHRLRLPDSGLAPCETQLVSKLLPLVAPHTHIVAPWPHDFHPDHEVCGRAAQRVAALTGAQLTFYFFWTWHRADVSLLAGLRLRSFALSPDLVHAKQSALACHRSQLHRADGEPILPANLLAPAARPFEVYLPA